MEIPCKTSGDAALRSKGVERQNSRRLSADVWPSAAIDQLAELVRRVMPQDPSAIDPRSFLRSLSSDWIARVLVVRCGSEIVGVTFTKEKKIAGIPTGVIYADGGLGNLVLAEREDQEAVLRAALEKLLGSRRIQALRLVVPPDGYEIRVARDVATSRGWDSGETPLFWNHARLPLPASYDAFLNSLGPRTRRNFRYYRKKFEDAKHRYVPQLSAAELHAAANHLRKKCSIQSSRREVDRKLNWVDAEDRPFACGLRSQDGEWLSVAAGFCGPTGATMLMQQNNDLDFERNSLSLVLRGYLIESLIQANFQELIFWGGPGGALIRYVNFVPGTSVFLDSRGYVWKLFRWFVRILTPAVPRNMRETLNWIAPKLKSYESFPGQEGNEET
jgi:hypothetical protein